ncbi:cbb3-type cytochrome oxidase assembly protein CcoS [Spirosoma radiotolerans]|uniref:cbb3-type cytochrome oxidase assembly protein CcoS n=1 Tax=Spirosoma radiotolerans TaxID=1379870 RepID=UPI0009E509EF|nr:cbb3-type cytochrome oxidase assembly protein CcoS [Spirosoma radiotolerans]
MHIIFFMIGVSLLMALGFLGAFFWAMKTGQQDDLYTPSMRMLLDDETPVTPETEPTVL